MIETSLRKIKFSSFIKFTMLIHMSLGVMFGIISFIFGLLENFGLDGVYATFTIGNMVVTGVLAGILFLILLPLLFAVIGLIIAVLSYLPFKYWIKWFGLKFVTEVEEKANSAKVYDTAKQHYEDVFPDDLTVDQAYVHTGMFLGWAIENELISKVFEEKVHSEIHKFRRKEITGAEIYKHVDGVLTDSMLTDEANQFATYYYNGNRSLFLQDYKDTFSEAETIYHVENNWDNYMKLKEVIDKRYWDWKENGDISN